ncbi:hypothetical protein RFI_28152 [Reticulomyxa filosa]|uniref:IRG-type G domain-containing protein n=1 Tax=Reticulomyxa filosa TaxID=46433 RepID=X6M885_RETFI|nr:hypothetical protein RFI_28152 [Reticulomyxa filosa]|eukprot:ETO09235.1 hypothetical protein RFI_28152 [Reticulomyxa filosa]
MTNFGFLTFFFFQFLFYGSKSSYDQWIRIIIENKSNELLDVKNSKLEWGKWYCNNDKSDEGCGPSKYSHIGSRTVLSSCGRSDVTSGTEGYFELIATGNMRVASFRWDCPYGRKNSYSVSDTCSGWKVNAYGGSKENGPIGEVIIIVEKDPPPSPPPPTRPKWLLSDAINVAVCGGSGVGKSSLVNAIRGLKPGDPKEAKIDVCETTNVHQDYPFSFDVNSISVNFSIWDLPGAGTVNHPYETYIVNFGIGYMNLVMVVVGERLTPFDCEMIKFLEQKNIIYYIVRNKFADTANNNLYDNNITHKQTYNNARSYINRKLKKVDINVANSRIYLLSSRDKNFADWDSFIREFKYDLSNQVSSQDT